MSHEELMLGCKDLFQKPLKKTVVFCNQESHDLLFVCIHLPSRPISFRQTLRGKSTGYRSITATIEAQYLCEFQNVHRHRGEHYAARTVPSLIKRDFFP
jgi:hypothetical protein